MLVNTAVTWKLIISTFLLLQYVSMATYNSFSQYGGLVSAADYCPFVGQWQNQLPPYCEDASNSGDAGAYEFYGAHSAW